MPVTLQPFAVRAVLKRSCKVGLTNNDGGARYARPTLRLALATAGGGDGLVGGSGSAPAEGLRSLKLNSSSGMSMRRVKRGSSGPIGPGRSPGYDSGDRLPRPPRLRRVQSPCDARRRGGLRIRTPNNSPRRNGAGQPAVGRAAITSPAPTPIRSARRPTGTRRQWPQEAVGGQRRKGTAVEATRRRRASTSSSNAGVFEPAPPGGRGGQVRDRFCDQREASERTTTWKYPQ